MKLLFITAVAVVLLYSVVAKRTAGPANVPTSPRRFRDSPDVRAEHSIGTHRNTAIKPRRPWTRNLKVTRVSPKTVYGKFPGKATLEDLLKNAERHSKNKSPDVKGRRRSFAPELHPARRIYHLRSSKSSDHPMSFEPVISHSFLHSSINHKVGPLIGPLNFPGMGDKVYIRLLVPPSQETSSHVTLHLVNNGPVETSHVIHDHEDFENFEKPKPSFPHTKPTLAQIPPREVIVTEEKNRFVEGHRTPNALAQIPPREVIVTEEKNRFVERPVGQLDFTPSNIKAFEFHEAQKHSKIHPNVNHIQNQLIDDQQQYLAAPNHYQLPLAFRPVENLMNLPVYPPLSTAGESQVEKQRDVETLTSSQKDMETAVSDAQQSASFKHTWASPDLSKFSPGWSPSRVLGPRQPEVIVNRRETPASEFIEEVRAPNFRFAYSSSRPVQIWGKSENTIVHPNSSENGFLVQPKYDATTSAAASNQEGEHRSTTLSSLTSTVASSPASVKGKKKKIT